MDVSVEALTAVQKASFEVCSGFKVEDAVSPVEYVPAKLRGDIIPLSSDLVVRIMAIADDTAAA